MMKLYSFFALLAALPLASFSNPALAQDNPPAVIYESPREFFGRGDFDGDGRVDLVIVDKESGKYRLGYMTASGMVNWVDCRPSGVKGISGFSIGKIFAKNLDAFAFTSPDGNQITLVDGSSPTAPGKPVTVPFTAALGPSTIVAVDIGSAAKTGLLDLFVGSIYNSPDPNMATFLRNDGSQFPKIGDATLPAPVAHGNRVAFKAGQPELLCTLLNEDRGDTFRAENLSSGKPAPVLSAPGLAVGSDYTVGSFRGAGSRELLFYKPGQNQLTVRPVEAGGQLALGKGDSFDLGQPIRRVVVLAHGAGERLFVIFGEGEKAGIFNFDGVKAPGPLQTLSATNDQFTCAANVPDGFVAFVQTAGGKFSSRYQIYKASGDTYVPGVFGGLPSLADNDNITIPDIHARIVANQKVATQAEMKAYTNTIPGTRVTYALVPIPGGEFTMGSADGEVGRKDDEGPQHKVKISPFWMGQCEVTWNEYELFMYPEEERQMRSVNPSNTGADKLADAVSHPSRPYVEMSFGMGKDGFPAISMTQHGANKYCQWLSAKTGEFYRLPTEAEWEYAARAGTTTPYFFGSDTNRLGEYAWYEQNSDFKYQKVGKKKPNPWGLYDIYGNVLEWTLDQYDPAYYKQCSQMNEVTDPWNKATKPYRHSTRGGSWDDEALSCRSAARRPSDRTWKMTDPQLPKSVWYLSDAQWIGFRIIRPLKVPTAEQMQKYWSSGVERD